MNASGRLGHRTQRTFLKGKSSPGKVNRCLSLPSSCVRLTVYWFNNPEKYSRSLSQGSGHNQIPVPQTLDKSHQSNTSPILVLPGIILFTREENYEEPKTYDSSIHERKDHETTIILFHYLFLEELSRGS